VSTPTPPPGWYPDPSDPATRRWWDGRAWSAQTQRPPAATFTPGAAPSPYAPPAAFQPGAAPSPAPYAPPAAFTAPAGPDRRRRGLLVASAVAAALVTGGIGFAAGQATATGAEPAATTITVVETIPVEVPVAEEPEEAPTALRDAIPALATAPDELLASQADYICTGMAIPGVSFEDFLTGFVLGSGDAFTAEQAEAFIRASIAWKCPELTPAG
jgi:hypothetical protein